MNTFLGSSSYIHFPRAVSVWKVTNLSCVSGELVQPILNSWRDPPHTCTTSASMLCMGIGCLGFV